MEHLTQEQALDYISGNMDEEMSFEVDRHLATCDRCVRRVRALRDIRYNFDAIWDSWTAQSHGEAHVRARIADALSEAATAAESDELRNRIESWIEKIQLKAEAALGVAIDTSKKTAKLVYQGLDDLCRPDPVLQFQPIRVSTEGIGEKAPARISVRAPGPPWAEIDVDAAARGVTVQFDLQKEPWPLLLLVPKSEDQKPIVGILKRKDDYLLAELRGVPDGEYVLLIQPLD